MEIMTKDEKIYVLKKSIHFAIENNKEQSVIDALNKELLILIDQKID